MTSAQIHKWLMTSPRPARVRVTDMEGAVSDVLCGQTTWVKLAETIEAMQPDQLQALNEQGAILRAIRPNDHSEDWSSEEEPPRNSKPRMVPPAIDIPIADMDPETKRLLLVARLIADAYRHSTDVAFERLAELVEAGNRRAEAVDQAREAMYRTHVRQLEQQVKALGEQPAEAPNDLLGSMIAAAVQGIGLGGNGGAGAGGAPNGSAAS